MLNLKLNKIGIGSSRIVYDGEFLKDKVIKFAFNERGACQNYIESNLSGEYRFLNKILEKDTKVIPHYFKLHPKDLEIPNTHNYPVWTVSLKADKIFTAETFQIYNAWDFPLSMKGVLGAYAKIAYGSFHEPQSEFQISDRSDWEKGKEIFLNRDVFSNNAKEIFNWFLNSNWPEIFKEAHDNELSLFEIVHFKNWGLIKNKLKIIDCGFTKEFFLKFHGDELIK